MKNCLLFALLLLPFCAHSQINVADSTVQVIGYWDRNEKHTYDIEYQKSRVKGKDTTVTQTITYKVDITVVDSTAKSYTIEWKYRDYKITGKSVLTDKVSKLGEGLTVRFKTDEMGSFAELLNWKDIKKHNEAALKALQKETKLPPELFKAINKLSTKEAIEANSIKDVLQFHTFFGVALKYGEPIENTSEDASRLGNTAVKSEYTLELSEINNEDANYLVKFWQTFNPDDINAVIGSVLGEYTGNEINGTVIATAMEDYCGGMMHDSGWPIDMFYQRTLEIKAETFLETRSITLE